MSWVAAQTMPTRGERERWALSWATRNASEKGAPLRLLADDVKQTLESVTEPGPREKLDILLALLVSRTESFASPAPFDYNTEWPLIYARGPAEASKLLVSLTRLGFADDVHPNPLAAIVTMKGWDRFDAIPRKGPSTPTKAFVAMWFNPAMNPAFDEGFKRALEALGYDPIRVDREQYLGKVDDFILASIRASGLLIADFTGMRSGVFFEAGFGLGLGIPVVWTCGDDWRERLGEHFDTRQYNHIIWKTPADLAEKLVARIEATIPTRPKRRV